MGNKLKEYADKRKIEIITEEAVNEYFKQSYKLCCNLHNDLQKCISKDKKINALIFIILELVDAAALGNIDYSDVFGSIEPISRGVNLDRASELAENLDKETYQEICENIKIYGGK